MELLGWIALGLVVLGALSLVWHTLALGIGPSPTSAAVKREVLELVTPDLTGVIHELGAGWGTLAFALADRCPRAQVIAWERSPVPYLVCRVRQALSPRSNLELRRRDFFAESLAGATLVVCYLFTGAMERLAEKLPRELTSGTAVLSHTFGVRGWTAELTRTVDDLYRTPVYRYRVPSPAALVKSTAEPPTVS